MVASAERSVLGYPPGTIDSTDQDSDALSAEGTGRGPAVSIRSNLPYIYFVNTDSGTHTLTLFTRSQLGTQIPYPLASGAMVAFPTSAFSTARDGNANGTVYYFHSDVPLSGPSIAGGTSTGAFSGEVVAQNGTAPLTSVNLFGAGTPADLDHIIITDGSENLIINTIGSTNPGGSIKLIVGTTDVRLNNETIFFAGGMLTKFNNVQLALNGVFTLLGADNRIGRNATDGAAITVYTTTTANPLLRLMARVFGTSGTVTSAVYTVKFTEGGNVITKTLTISAVDTDADLSILIQPDTGTVISAQLTTLTGAAAVVDVACTVETVNGS